ncbi:CXXC motif containing zinc binding protein-like [Anneissia japonica]|uniref:CXXC motif containing zinc binding protein-like n=1 Tax=Anneissia japonica TaxID=1529436 RepID=UPI0014256124|nr:CXXC motif containing zinc binding protein-like [Anneissia japonica]
MVRIGLQIQANLENVTNLRPEGDDFRWYLKLKCQNCQEESKSFVYISLLESHPLKGGRGSASLVSKCKLCSRENSIDILKDTIKSYDIEDNNQMKTIVGFECRGMEPVDFSPRVGFVCSGVESSSTFQVDLTEKEWVDYDENAQESVGVYEVEWTFVKL